MHDGQESGRWFVAAEISRTVRWNLENGVWIKRLYLGSAKRWLVEWNCQKFKALVVSTLILPFPNKI